MKGHHRQMEAISSEALAAGLAATPITHHVIWTGVEAAGQPGSLRIRALGCIREVGVPVSLRVLLQRAARLDGDLGLDPAAVRSCVRSHQGAKPAVLLLVERRASGDFVAVTDIPHAGALRRSVRSGDVLMDGDGLFRFDVAVAEAPGNMGAPLPRLAASSAAGVRRPQAPWSPE